MFQNCLILSYTNKRPDGTSCLVMVNPCIAHLSLMPSKQVNASGFTWIHVESMLSLLGAGENPHA